MSKENVKVEQLMGDELVVSGSNKDKHFIDDDIFQGLLAIREEIYQKTDINVSPRKLVNMLLKQSDFSALRDQLIEQYA